LKEHVSLEIKPPVLEAGASSALFPSENVVSSLKGILPKNHNFQGGERLI
jgi:hypothetical protein